MGQKQNRRKKHNPEKLIKLLKESVSTSMELEYSPIEYKIDWAPYSMELEEDKNEEEKENEFEFDFNEEFSGDKYITSTDKKLTVKNIKKYPFTSFGILKVKFSQSEDIFENICFRIDANIIVTLASNLYNKDKGGKALHVTTSFTGETQIKWDSIHIQPNKDNKNIKLNETKNKNKDIIEENDLKNKFAVIIQKNIGKEWFGVRILRTDESIEQTDFYSIFLIDTKKKEEKDNNNNNIIKIKEEPILGEVSIYKENPFLNTYNRGIPEDKQLLKKNIGNPIFTKDYNGGADIVGIVNEQYEFHFLDEDTINFLQSEIRNIKRIKEGIDMDRIEKLNFANKGLGPHDLDDLWEFEFKNLKVIDLSGNSILSIGTRMLCDCSLVNIEILNLNFNEIGDAGVQTLSKSRIQRLKQLHLFYNNLTFNSIDYIAASKFVNTLEILSLSENPNITDQGTVILSVIEDFKKLKILHMNSTGLTDKGLKNLNNAFIPLLEILNVQGNNFTDEGLKFIEEMKKRDIKVKYMIEK